MLLTGCIVRLVDGLMVGLWSILEPVKLLKGMFFGLITSATGLYDCYWAFGSIQRTIRERGVLENLADSPMMDMALARIRQLSAHEVGHTLGIYHNFASSEQSGICYGLPTS